MFVIRQIGVGLERVLGHALEYLDDAWRVTTPSTPIPYSPPLEDAFLPLADAIVEAVLARA